MALFKLSPVMALIVFFTINFLINLDRGALSALVTILESSSEGLGLTSFLIGTLGSVFILGNMITGPFWAHFPQFYHPEYLISIGIGIWTLAVLLTGLSRSYPLILVARTFGGVGEASVVCLVPPVIMDIAPGSNTNVWIAIFYIGNVLGFAIGFVFGNQVSNLFGAWYYPFYIEAVLMTPFFLLLVFNYKDPKFYYTSNSGQKIHLGTQIKILAKNPVFVNFTLGLAGYTFVIAAISFWVKKIKGPNYIEEHFSTSSNAATLLLGGITIFTGILGTYTGSILLNKKMKNYESDFLLKKITSTKYDNIRTEKSAQICFFVALIACILGTIGAIIDTLSFFLIGLALGELFLFLCISPCTVGTMTCVASNLRGQANAVSLFFSYALGGFLSPTIIGGVFDLLNRKWGMVIAMGWLFWAALFWGFSWLMSKNHSGPLGYSWNIFNPPKTSESLLSEVS